MIQNNFMPEGWDNVVSTLDNSNINEIINNQTTLQGIVTDCDDDFNLHIDLGNYQGVMPRSEVEGINLQRNGLPKTNLCTGKVNKFVQFKVKDVGNNGIAILSRKAVQSEALDWVKKDLKVGDIVTGIVKRVESYGVFIEIGGGVVGLAHIEDLSVARIKSAFERVSIGQKLEVMVKSIDKESGKLVLSYKELLGTWEENADKFNVGQRTTGIVRETEKHKNGIFIELLPNLVGMAEYVDGLEYGQEVNVYIKRIDYERRKVKLLVV